MKKLYSAEYVLPGHPDKLCDAVADAIVAAAVKRESRALVGVEVAVHRSALFVTGRVACDGAEKIDIRSIARRTLSSAGYGGDWIPEPKRLKVTTDLCVGPLQEKEDSFRRIADDQSIVTGYAVDIPATNCLSPEHWIAYRLSRRFESLRTDRPDLQLGPDGKVILEYEEDDGEGRLVSFSASLQQKIGGPEIELHRVVYKLLEDELLAIAGELAGFDPAVPAEVLVNAAGNFEEGGPDGDNGLSGKKLVVDAYGPRVPIGGGALSGKDFYKVDRAGAILARRLAKLVVLTGVARECTATLAIYPGDTSFRIVSLEDGSGRRLETDRWQRLLDLSLEGVGDAYGSYGDLIDVARHGHFTSADLPWEQVRFCGPDAARHVAPTARACASGGK